MRLRHAGTGLALALFLAIGAQVLAQFAPCESALLVIDVQEIYIPIEPWTTSSGEGIVTAVEHLLGLARVASVPVIYTLDMGSTHGGRVHMDRIQPPSEIAPLEDEIVFERETESALDSSGLYDYLVEAEISRLLICGIASDGCVRTTLLDAIARGFDVLVIEDAHASWQETSAASSQISREWAYAGIPVSPMVDVPWEQLGCDGSSP